MKTLPRWLKRVRNWILDELETYSTESKWEYMSRFGSRWYYRFEKLPRTIGRLFQRLFRMKWSLKVPMWYAWEWHDSDTQMLELNFQILVNYVEREWAWMNWISQDRPWYRRYWMLSRADRIKLSREYMTWATTDPECVSCGQTESARKVWELYEWWTVTVPARPDPWGSKELDKASKLNDTLGPAFGPLKDGFYEMREFHPDYSNALGEADKIDTQYYDEDTQKLKELIDIRAGMWT